MADKEAPREGRRTAIHRPEYDALREVLSEAISRAGVSQRALSAKLGKPPTHVNRVLSARRTLEWSELLDLCAAVDTDVAEVVAEAIRRSKRP